MRAQRRNRARGVAAIELGLILPVFCFLLFGLIDYGYWFMVDLAATNAVREGARTATTYAGGCAGGGGAQGVSAIQSYFTNVGLGGLAPAPTCTCTELASPPGPQFTCVLQLDFQRLSGYSLVPMPSPSGGQGSDYTSVRATAVMRGTD